MLMPGREFTCVRGREARDQHELRQCCTTAIALLAGQWLVDVRKARCALQRVFALQIGIAGMTILWFMIWPSACGSALAKCKNTQSFNHDTLAAGLACMARIAEPDSCRSGYDVLGCSREVRIDVFVTKMAADGRIDGSRFRSIR
jgi:hypothetical protein